MSVKGKTVRVRNKITGKVISAIKVKDDNNQIKYYPNENSEEYYVDGEVEEV